MSVSITVFFCAELRLSKVDSTILSYTVLRANNINNFVSIPQFIVKSKKSSLLPNTGSRFTFL
ncbi:MAG: hypothetical protein IJH65_08900 [Methanobrevibacter sp.]|nr:hypothetical protein [Methanobrevibacter sp.]